MTLPRLEAVVAHWEKVPPLSSSVAAIAHFCGVERKARAPSVKVPKAEGKQDVQALMELLGANGFGQEKPTWLSKT